MPTLESATEGTQAVASILRIGAVVVGAVILWRLFQEGSDAASSYEETIDRNFREQTPDIYDTGNTGLNEATEYATRETSMGAGIVGSILGDSYPAEKSQTGRQEAGRGTVPNYQGDAIWGWERLSTPNYTEPERQEEPTPVSGGRVI